MEESVLPYTPSGPYRYRDKKLPFPGPVLVTPRDSEMEGSPFFSLRIISPKETGFSCGLLLLRKENGLPEKELSGRSMSAYAGAAIHSHMHQE